MSIRSVKICMVCCLTKPVKYESDYKSNASRTKSRLKTFGKKKDNGLTTKSRHMIHEYNYSCYECLDNMKKQQEKQLREIYDKMLIVGLLPST